MMRLSSEEEWGRLHTIPQHMGRREALDVEAPSLIGAEKPLHYDVQPRLLFLACVQIGLGWAQRDVEGPVSA